jgi:hypothetical protein
MNDPGGVSTGPHEENHSRTAGDEEELSSLAPDEKPDAEKPGEGSQETG